LGAGKTTFINQLLQKYSDRKFALVENEFGEVAIDTKLVKGLDASQMFELKEGCICCTITDEYELTLKELAQRFPYVEHLLIETTGIADPAPVIRPFFSDESLKEIYRFNGTICIFDAIHFDEIPEKEISFKQLAVADLILINKSEHLAKDQQDIRIKEIGKLNPFVQIITTEFGNTDEVSLDNVVQKVRNAFDFVSLPSSHRHLSAKLLEFEKPIQKEEFLRWFTYLMDVNKRTIYRVKGILYFENEPFEYILQGVGGNFELTEGELVIESGVSRMVFIGNLHKIELKANF